MIPIAKPIIDEEEKKAVINVLESGMLAQGENVEKFEKAFADFIGVKHAIATSSGTAALHTSLLACGVGLGDEVITSPFTFIATANVIRMVGAKPIFVDINERTFNIDTGLIESAITAQTKAIMPIHLFGRPAEMEIIAEIAERHNLVVIEDACQAHGAEFKGKKAGSFGTGCFSFYPTKNMTTGEGGMITTNDEKIAEKARMTINHGSSQKYCHDFLGYNHRMTDIAAAIGLEQLKKLKMFNVERRNNALYLNQKLAAVGGLVLPEVVEGHVFHQYVVRVTQAFGKTRDELLELLLREGVGCSVFYPIPVHKQKAYLEYNGDEFPVAEKVSQEVLSLPVHPSVEKEDMMKMVEMIKGVKK